MHKKKIVVIFLSLVFFITITRVEAKEKKFGLGFSAGLCNWPSDAFKYMKLHPQESLSQIFPIMNTLEQEIELKAQYNLNFQYNFNPRLGIQAEIEHQKADYRVLFALLPKTGSKAIYPQHHLSWSISSIFLNLIFRARKSEEKIIPYVFAGLGLCFIRGEDDFNQDYYRLDIPSTTDLGLKAGAGLTFYLDSINIPLGFDLKSFIQVLGPKFGGYPSSYYGSDSEIGGWNIIWGVEIGLKYRF